MPEIITGIERIGEDDGYAGFAGLIIDTDQQSMFFGIDANVRCCEEWGCILSRDDADLHTFIGAEIVSVSQGVIPTYSELREVFRSAPCFTYRVRVSNEGILESLEIGLWNRVGDHHPHPDMSHAVVVISDQLRTSRWL